jgi:hypothetical protein
MFSTTAVRFPTAAMLDRLSIACSTSGGAEMFLTMKLSIGFFLINVQAENEDTDRREPRRQRGCFLSQARLEKDQFVAVCRVGGFQKHPIIIFGTEDRYPH